MKEYPLGKAFMLIEPGPVVMVTSAGQEHPNVATITWTTVLDWSPRLALCTGPWNYTVKALLETKECVISIPTVELAKKVVSVGTCSSKDVDKFKKFGLTAEAAAEIGAPLIKECYANIECRVIDHIEKYNIIVLEGVKAWVDGSTEHPKFMHAVGDGHFTVDGETLDLREYMPNKLPPGV